VSAPIRIVDVTSPEGIVIERRWLAQAERVHRQLRPKLPADYALAMQRVFAGGGRMCVATDGETVTGVAVHRVYVNTVHGLHMYVDDLVTDETRRSTGVGKALLDHLQGIARAAGCNMFTLDSGVQRQQAHKFYFREGMVVAGFHFSRSLT
jgi:GNAT superfamily N-acetyltransferase